MVFSSTKLLRHWFLFSFNSLVFLLFLSFLNHHFLLFSRQCSVIKLSFGSSSRSFVLKFRKICIPHPIVMKVDLNPFFQKRGSSIVILNSYETEILLRVIFLQQTFGRFYVYTIDRMSSFKSLMLNTSCDNVSSVRTSPFKRPFKLVFGDAKIMICKLLEDLLTLKKFSEVSKVNKRSRILPDQSNYRVAKVAPSMVHYHLSVIN